MLLCYVCGGKRINTLFLLLWGEIKTDALRAKSIMMGDMMGDLRPPVLRLSLPIQGVEGSNPSWGTKIQHAADCSRIRLFIITIK